MEVTQSARHRQLSVQKALPAHKPTCQMKAVLSQGTHQPPSIHGPMPWRSEPDPRRKLVAPGRPACKSIEAGHQHWHYAQTQKKDIKNYGALANTTRKGMQSTLKMRQRSFCTNVWCNSRLGHRASRQRLRRIPERERSGMHTCCAHALALGGAAWLVVARQVDGLPPAAKHCAAVACICYKHLSSNNQDRKRRRPCILLQRIRSVHRPIERLVC